MVSGWNGPCESEGKLPGKDGCRVRKCARAGVCSAPFTPGKCVYDLSTVIIWDDLSIYRIIIFLAGDDDDDDGYDDYYDDDDDDDDYDDDDDDDDYDDDDDDDDDEEEEEEEEEGEDGDDDDENVGCWWQRLWCR